MKQYKCPCCGQRMLDDNENYVCYYCGWNDLMGDRGDEDGGINIISLNKAKELYKQGKNVQGGKLPMFSDND